MFEEADGTNKSRNVFILTNKHRCVKFALSSFIAEDNSHFGYNRRYFFREMDEGYLSDGILIEDICLFDGILIEEPEPLDFPGAPGFPDRMRMENVPYTLPQENVFCRIKEKEK